MMKKLVIFLNLIQPFIKITCKGYNYFRNRSFGYKNLNLELGDKHKENTKTSWDCLRGKNIETEKQFGGVVSRSCF